jgi:hypothetical protein
MPRDSKARVVSVGNFTPYDDPTYGPGAVRAVIYEDGTIEYRFFHYDTQKNQQGPPDQGFIVREGLDPELSTAWATRQRAENPAPPQRAPRTSEEEARDKQQVAEGERKAEEDRRKSALADREEKERQYNASHPDSKGRAFAETHADRAARELREQADERAEDARSQSQRAEARQAETAARNAEIAAGQLEVSRGNLDIEREREARAARKPEFLSQANESNPFLIRYNPETGQIESMNNPNFDSVKQESERLRSLLAVQIQAKNATLDEAKQQYTQWYDTNVKTPMLLAQDARDRAAEQRQALDAEERRRQFAANFGLQKAELGQRAGAAAMQAEQSLLPYRAGPTESAEMSSAINSLAAGGTMAGPRADAGIHFTPGAFEFDAPDFKAIAKRAAADAIKGISSYKPSGEKYATADYSNVPAVNTSGAPAVPTGYGDFQSIIDQLQSTYNFGGPKG